MSKSKFNMNIQLVIDDYIKREDHKIKKPEFLSYIKNNKKLQAILMILLLIILIFSIIDLKKSIDLVQQPFEKEYFEVVAYEINLDITGNIPENTIIMKSDETFKLKNKSLNVAIPLVEIHDNLYPLSSDLVKRKYVVKYNETDLYLLEEISPKKINITYYYKINKTFDDEDIYYCSSKLDSYLFLALVQNGYNKVISYCSKELLRIPKDSMIWTLLADKIYFSEKNNYTICGVKYGYVLNLFSKDIKTIEYVTKIADADEQVYVYTHEDKMTAHQVFSHRESF